MNIVKDKFVTKNLDNYAYLNQYSIDKLESSFNSKSKSYKIFNYDDNNNNNNNDNNHEHGNKSAGRGIGNVDIANNIHFSISSRDKNIDKFVTLDRFEYLDKNLQDPQFIVMDDLPRGGVCTRKQIQLPVVINYNQNTNHNPYLDTNNINFDYN